MSEKNIEPKGELTPMKLSEIFDACKKEISQYRRTFEEKEALLQDHQGVCQQCLHLRDAAKNSEEGVALFESDFDSYLADKKMGVALGKTIAQAANIRSFEAWQPFLLQFAALDVMRQHRAEILAGYRAVTLDEAVQNLKNFEAENRIVLQKYGLF